MHTTCHGKRCEALSRQLVHIFGVASREAFAEHRGAQGCQSTLTQAGKRRRQAGKWQERPLRSRGKSWSTRRDNGRLFNFGSTLSSIDPSLTWRICDPLIRQWRGDTPQYSIKSSLGRSVGRWSELNGGRPTARINKVYRCGWNGGILTHYHYSALQCAHSL